MARDTSMRALVKAGPNVIDTQLTSTDIPEIGPKEVLIRVLACGLCGSDVHAWRGDSGYEWVQTPVILGHEIVGEVIAVGDGAPEQLLGRRVVPISIDGCGQCRLCTGGFPQLCEQRSVLGLSFDGGISEYLAISHERLVLVPDAVSTGVAVLTEPLSVALHAVDLLGELPDDAVVGVSGPGPVGLLAAWALAQRNVEVYVTGIERDEATRLPMARKLGLSTHTVDYPQATHWVEASGSQNALNDAIATLGAQGTVVVVALYGSNPTVDLNPMVRNQIRLIGSYASVAADYEASLKLLSNGRELTNLITEYPLSDALLALSTTAKGMVGKAVVVP